MAITQIRGNTQIKAGTILDAQISASAAIQTSKLAEGAEFLKRDGTVALTGNLNANSNKIVNLAAPVDAGDAVNKGHIDTELLAYLKHDGSVALTGNLNADNNSVINLAAPVNANDAARKVYVDDLDALNVRLDGTRAMTGDLDLNNNKITNLADPVSASDAANKGYVDSVAQGLDVKLSVRAATTGNITLSGLQTIDGVALVQGDRVLVKSQANAVENGIYVAGSGAWVRSDDMSDSSQATAGAFTFVEEGTANADSGWVISTDNPIVLDTDPVNFVQFSGAGSFEAGAGLLKTGNTIDIISANGAIVVNADDVALTLEDASLEITSSGLKIATGTAGQVLVGDASGVPLATTLSGDVASVTASGEVTLISTIARKADVIVREVPTGAIDGSNTAFSLANSPVDGTEAVFLNGLLLNAGGDDYSISNNAITMVAAPESGDRLLVTYIK
jgi:hypothetical protein